MTQYGWLAGAEDQHVLHLYEILPGPPRMPLCKDAATEVEHCPDGTERCVRCRRYLIWMEIFPRRGTP